MMKIMLRINDNDDNYNSQHLVNTVLSALHVGAIIIPI